VYEVLRFILTVSCIANCLKDATPTLLQPPAPRYPLQDFEALHKYCIIVSRPRPHRSTTYVNAANCYRPSTLVCRSVCRSVTLVSPAKTAVPIGMPFGLRTQVSPGNHVLDGGPDLPMERGNFEGEGTSNCKV